MAVLTVPDQDFDVVDKFARYVRACRLRYSSYASDMQAAIRGLGIVVMQHMAPSPRPAVPEPPEATR